MISKISSSRLFSRADRARALLLVSLCVGVRAAPGIASVSAALEASSTARLADTAPLEVENVTLGIGLARLTIHKAQMYPAEPVAGKPREFVLIGLSTLALDPPNEIEAHQLEVYTGARQLRELVEQAVFVLGHQGAIDSLLSKAPVTAPAGEREQAQRLFEEWRASGERRHLHVDASIARAAVADPGSANYFAGWFDSQKRGRMLYVVDPWSPEQVSLRQFVPAALTSKEERKLRRYIDKQQRRDRLGLLEMEDLGTWNTWLMESLERDGQAVRGSSGYEPVHYELDVDIEPKERTIRGTARIRLRADAMAGLGVQVKTSGTTRITSARSGDEDLVVSSRITESIVFLEQRPQPGQEIELTLYFENLALTELTGVFGNSFTLDHTILWHPHVGDIDVATYDVTLRWPKKWDVLAAGKLAASGVERGVQHGTWEIDRPTIASSFEIGRFDIAERQVGDILVRLAINRSSSQLIGGDGALLDYIERPLRFLQETFGPLDLDEMTFVTSHHEFSQSLYGFVTLSAFMLIDDPLFMSAGLEDPRTVIAHEIAHQWWGHRAKPLLYRDIWLNESLADYSAELYAQRELQHLGGWASPTEGWERGVALRAGPVRVGDLGPIVLGTRLDSSLSDTAYSTIVYQKGALVLQMLAELIGRERFNEILEQVANATNDGLLTTQQLLAVVEQASGLDLQPFADSFIYGTHQPLFEVSYEVEPASDGKWLIRGVVEYLDPLRTEYRVVRRGEKLDVARAFVVKPSPPWTPLVAAVRIEIAQGESERAAKREAEWLEPPAMIGRILLEQPTQPFELLVDQQPGKFSLDPKRRSYAFFADVSDDPASPAARRARRAVAAGNLDEAERLFRESLAHLEGNEPDSLAGRGRTQLELARIEIERGRLAAAQQALKVVSSVLREDKDTKGRLANQAAVLQARILLLEGDATLAFKLLKKIGVDRLGIEGQLVLAQAARQVGEDDLFESIVESPQITQAQVKNLELLTAQ